MSRVLFVCLGNICRSPTAEAVFRARAMRAGLSPLEVDSAGTGDWHIGDPPDLRAIAVGGQRGYALEALRGRQIEAADFERFAHIIVMDKKNLSNVLALAPDDYKGSVRLFLDYAGQHNSEVPDPYLGGPGDFDRVIDMIERASDGLISALQNTDQAAKS